MQCPHTHFRQGQKVFVHLRSGESFRDRFHEHRSNHVVLQERGKVFTKSIRAISIDKSR